MSKLRKHYTKEEKLEIVKLSLDEHQTIQSLSARFEISAGTIYNWRSKYLKNKETAFPGKGNKELTASERKIEEWASFQKATGNFPIYNGSC